MTLFYQEINMFKLVTISENYYFTKYQLKYFNDENILVGYVLFDLVNSNGYEYFFQDYISEKDYQKFIKTENYIYLEMIYVNQDNRQQGIANKLMKEFINIVEVDFFGNNIILFVFPLFELKIKNISEEEILVRFYESFGFNSLNLANFMILKLYGN